MNIDKEYAKEVELLLDNKESEIAALKLRCATQENKISKLEKELSIYRLTDFSNSNLGEIIPDLLKPQSE